MASSNIHGCKSLWRFINPSTLIRPDFLAGSSMTLLALARHRESWDQAQSRIHQNNRDRSSLGPLVSARRQGHVDSGQRHPDLGNSLTTFAPVSIEDAPFSLDV